MKKLTKNQIKQGAEQVSETLIRLTNPKGFFKVLILVIVLLFTNVTKTTPGLSSERNSASAMTIQPTEEQLYVDELKTKMKTELIKEVQTYITNLAPNSRLTPENIVNKCLEYDTDIIFVLSQALLESHFGTKGKAAQTNSVWNVGTYDDGQILYRYEHPDQSLEPYLKLINDKYLITVTTKGDTIYKDLGHLVEDRGYTNYDGRRFASARGYENGMRKLMVKIDMETSISFYQDILKLSEGQILTFFRPELSKFDDNFFYALN